MTLITAFFQDAVWYLSCSFTARNTVLRAGRCTLWWEPEQAGRYVLVPLYGASKIYLLGVSTRGGAVGSLLTVEPMADDADARAAHVASVQRRAEVPEGGSSRGGDAAEKAASGRCITRGMQS